MKIEIILLIVLASVFLIDYLVRKGGEASTSEIVIPKKSNKLKTKNIVRILVFIVFVLLSTYFYHFFPKKIINDVESLISNEKYEEAFNKIDSYKNIYNKKIYSDSLNLRIHRERILNYDNSLNMYYFREGSLDSINKIEKFLDDYYDFCLNINDEERMIAIKYYIFNFQSRVAKSVFFVNFIGEKNRSFYSDVKNFKVKQDSIENILESKIKDFRDVAFDEKYKNYLRGANVFNAQTSIITGDIEPMNKLLKLEDYGADEIEIVEFFLKNLRLYGRNYYGMEYEEQKNYYDFARKSRYKINKELYALLVLMDEILKDNSVYENIYSHNITEGLNNIMGGIKALTNKQQSSLEELFPAYLDLDIDSYDRYDWINFYWLKSSIYMNSNKNISLDALNTLDNFFLKENLNAENETTANAYDLWARVLYRIANIKSDKDDVKDALNFYRRAEKLYTFQGKDLRISDGIASPDYSDILYEIFRHKWNTKPYGDKNGACNDLKLAGRINADKYYDYYLSMCN